MVFLRLFWVFFKIGLFTIGGGHAMIPLIMQDVVAEGWISESILIDFIAISESTPGPFAVNIATYTGTTVGTTVGEAFGGFGTDYLVLSQPHWALSHHQSSSLSLLSNSFQRQ